MDHFYDGLFVLVRWGCCKGVCKFPKIGKDGKIIGFSGEPHLTCLNPINVINPINPINLPSPANRKLIYCGDVNKEPVICFNAMCGQSLTFPVNVKYYIWQYL